MRPNEEVINHVLKVTKKRGRADPSPGPWNQSEAEAKAKSLHFSQDQHTRHGYGETDSETAVSASREPASKEYVRANYVCLYPPLSLFRGLYPFPPPIPPQGLCLFPTLRPVKRLELF